MKNMLIFSGIFYFLTLNSLAGQVMFCQYKKGFTVSPKGDTTFFNTDTVGEKNIAGKKISVVPDFNGPRYLKKIMDTIMIDVQKNDTFLTNGTLKCIWYRNNILIEGENFYFIKPTESGIYTVKIEHPCYEDGVYRVQGSVNWFKTAVYDQKNNSFRIFPNPAEEYINISRPSENIEIFNLSGQSVGKYAGTKIDIFNLPSGFYFIKINNQMKKFQKI